MVAESKEVTAFDIGTLMLHPLTHCRKSFMTDLDRCVSTAGFSKATLGLESATDPFTSQSVALSE